MTQKKRKFSMENFKDNLATIILTVFVLAIVGGLGFASYLDIVFGRILLCIVALVSLLSVVAWAIGRKSVKMNDLRSR